MALPICLQNKGWFVVFFVKAISFIFTTKYRLFDRDRVQFGVNFVTNWRLKISGPGKVVFGDNICAWAHKESNNFLTFEPEAKISIGNNCRLNGATFQSKNEIIIGNNCIFGSTLVFDTDFHSTAIDRQTNPNAFIKSEPICIKDNVWICGQSTIMKGVIIEENSIVSYGTIVRKNVKRNVVVAGNPAQVIKQLNTII